MILPWRTPKGLSYLSTTLKEKDKNQLLFKMQEFQQMHCALWSECVWSIVDASASPTKFILSDNPVTFYNEACFPQSQHCKGALDPAIWLAGTYTIFPLSLNKALILTNLSRARNPYGNPLKSRPNSQLFRNTMFNFQDIQTGRLLDEQEVLSINFIIKNRSERYIAAAKKEWLFPEKYLKIKTWNALNSRHLLMPDPRSMVFTSGIIVGYGAGQSDAFDEYGRKPGQKGYKKEEENGTEWDSFHAFKGEFARIYGPERRGMGCRMGNEKSTDSDDFHKYHIGLESKHKSKLKKNKAKRKNMHNPQSLKANLKK